MAKKTSGSGMKGRAALTLLGLVLFAVAFGVFWNKYTQIRVIEVTGVYTQAAVDEIVARSGIEMGMHLSDIEENALGHALGSLGSWEFLGMETEGYSKVKLNMRTRDARAVAHYAGSSLVLDEYCQVMENRKDDPEYSLLQILGLQIQSAPIGQRIVTEDRNQVLSVSEVIRALDESGAYSRVLELNASDLDNLYLITVPGVKVTLGDSTDLALKCEWMISVLNSLEEEQPEGMYGGTVDVSSGSVAVFKPNK